MPDSSLEARIQRLEDIEAIVKLTSRYAHSVDRGVNGQHIDGELLPTLFSADATWRDAARQTDLHGRDDIVAFLVDEGAISFAQHSFSNPVIDVDGDTASARWLLWVAINAGGMVGEVFQSEDLTYRREGDGWVITSIDLHFGQLVTGSLQQA